MACNCKKGQRPTQKRLLNRTSGAPQQKSVQGGVAAGLTPTERRAAAINAASTPAPGMTAADLAAQSQRRAAIRKALGKG